MVNTPYDFMNAKHIQTFIALIYVPLCGAETEAFSIWYPILDIC